MSELHVVVMAAGKGSRMNHPDLPKVMVPIFGRPMIGHVLDSARSIAADSIVVVVGFRGELVSDWIASSYEDASIRTAWQRQQLGTAHAVMMAMPEIPETESDVLVLSGDVPNLSVETLTMLREHHRSRNAGVTLLSVELDDPTGYGRVVRDADGHPTKVVEDRDATPAEREIAEINAGIYLFDRSLLARLLPRVGSENAQSEFYLPDVVALALEENSTVTAFLAANPEEIEGVNTPEQLAAMQERG